VSLLDWKMLLKYLVHVGIIDGAICHYHNLTSIAWMIYSPLVQVVVSGGACLGPTTNNVAEYSSVIELLRDAIVHGILYLEVHLDSQFVVSQLNDEYCVRDPVLL
jgi:ribonuclease HI